MINNSSIKDVELKMFNNKNLKVRAYVRTVNENNELVQIVVFEGSERHTDAEFVIIDGIEYKVTDDIIVGIAVELKCMIAKDIKQNADVNYLLSVIFDMANGHVISKYTCEVIECMVIENNYKEANYSGSTEVDVAGLYVFSQKSMKS